MRRAGAEEDDLRLRVRCSSGLRSRGGLRFGDRESQQRQDYSYQASENLNRCAGVGSPVVSSRSEEP